MTGGIRVQSLHAALFNRSSRASLAEVYPAKSASSVEVFALQANL